jgi:NTE family protein
MAGDVAAAKGCDLVCEGGGIKVIGLAGAYAALEQAGYRPQHAAGSSAGAIVAALVAAGYTGAELKEVALTLDFRRFQDPGWKERLPLIGEPLAILLDQGLYEGERLLDWLRAMLAEKGLLTFGQLRTGSDDPRYAYRLQVIVSDLSARRLLVLPRDAHELGLEPDGLEVALAVRMSTAIPILFEPVRIQNPATNWEHVLVDGGILSNFPVWLFDSDEPPARPTFGLLLVEPDPRTPITERLPRPEHAPRGAAGLVQLLSGLVHTMLEAHDRMYVEQEQFARTIGIPTLGIGTTEFEISPERALALYESGHRAAQEFLAHWDFDAYVSAFRSGVAHSRRAEIATELRRAATAA